MSVICIICARGGSKGLRQKALRKINGKPLIFYTIQQAVRSNIFDKIVVSTDSKKIQKLAVKSGAKSWFLRPKKLSNDHASKESAIRHALLESEKHFGKKFDICIDLDITSPLRDVDDIKKALKQFIKDKSNILFSVCLARRNPYFNMVEKIGNKIELVKKTNKLIFRRQDAPKVYEMNASIYIWKREKLLKSDNLYGKKTSIYLMSMSRSLDIDTKLDFEIVKKLL